jgi:hypothetical protein
MLTYQYDVTTNIYIINYFFGGTESLRQRHKGLPLHTASPINFFLWVLHPFFGGPIGGFITTSSSTSMDLPINTTSPQIYTYINYFFLRVLLTFPLHAPQYFALSSAARSSRQPSHDRVTYMASPLKLPLGQPKSTPHSSARHN